MTRRNTGAQRRYPPAEPVPPPGDIDLEAVWLALATPRGYHGPPGPQQFRGGIARNKSYCRWCDLVARGAAACPQCGAPMLQMPRSWRPGRKGTRTRVWDVRVSRRRRQYRGAPDVVRQLGVKGLPPRPSFWYALDSVHQDIARRGIAQRARFRRSRS